MKLLVFLLLILSISFIKCKIVANQFETESNESTEIKIFLF